MMDEALSGAGTQRGPEPGWYPDPVGRAAHRYWNGAEWTANTRGPAHVTAPDDSGTPEPAPAGKPVLVPRPVPVETEPASTPPAEPEPVAPRSIAQPTATELPDVQSAGDQESLFGAMAEERSVSEKPESEPRVASPTIDEPSTPVQQSSLVQSSTPPPLSEDPRVAADEGGGGSRRLASLLGALLIASAAFAGGVAVQRFVLDGSTEATNAPTTLLTTTTTTSSATTTEDTAETERMAAQLEALEAELVAVTADRDQALAASGGDTAALEAQVANLETHVDTMRTWFTTEILSAADAAFEAEISRACAAEAEPTLDNTNYTNRMEPAGTHADIVAAALACRADGG